MPWIMRPTFQESYQKWSDEGYTFYGFDVDAQESIHEVNFPDKVAFIMGHKEF